MKPNTQRLLERFIRDAIDHALMNTDAEISTAASQQIANEIDNRIWLYIDEYFDFNSHS